LLRLDELGLRRPPTKGPALLLYDIETAPTLAWMWRQYDADIVATERDWYILCFAYKWVGQKGTRFVSVFESPDFEPDSDNDLWVAERAHALFCAATATVAHNNKRFDSKKSNARFMRWGFPPPPLAPRDHVDTLTEARRKLGHMSNSLGELARFHDLGWKTAHHGFSLWRDCMRGDPKAWKTMERYNRQDVNLLEKWYEKLRPWLSEQHPNWGHWDTRPKMEREEAPICPKCGRVGMRKDGFRYTSVSVFRKWRCGHWTKDGQVGCGATAQSRFRQTQRYDGGPAVH